MNLRLKSIIALMVVSIVLTSQLYSQSYDQIDSLANEMCETVILISAQNDSIGKPIKQDAVISQLGEKHVRPYISNIPSHKIDSMILLIELRLEKTCEEYGKIRYEQTENKGDWVRHSDKPEKKLKDIECKYFFKIENYSYLEPNGDKVELEIKNGYWVDHFLDGTFSRLKISTDENCDFTIEFVESNNEIRKGFSKKGDKYNYAILENNDGFYKLSVEIPEQSIYYTFNLYYKE
jgi:hypothetical protein